MKLSANPFHPISGELLSVYRDAYLRGDLSTENTTLVDAYIKANSDHADATLRRFYEMKQQGHQVQPVGWVQRQFDLIRTEPQRFRRRAASMLVGSVLVGGAVFANSGRTIENTAVAPVVAVASEATVAEAASAASLNAATVVVRGRILDENGHPLIGATVLQKGTSRGVSTDAQGNYSMRVPAGRTATLQYGYAGYNDDEIQVKGGRVENMTLLPNMEKAKKQKRHWLFF